MSETVAESMTALSGNNVVFSEEGGGSAQVRHICLFGACPENFENYRDDARRVIRVITGDGVKEGDEDLVVGMGLNAMGVNTFLAALAYEVCEQNYQCNIPHGVTCQYCDKDLRKNASREEKEQRDCEECPGSPHHQDNIEE